MSHTKGEWTYKQMNNGDLWIFEDEKVIARTVRDSTTANRIVTMHNSFDDLLEACKFAIENLYNVLPDSVLIRFKNAIAKAEGTK